MALGRVKLSGVSQCKMLEEINARSLNLCFQ